MNKWIVNGRLWRISESASRSVWFTNRFQR